MTKEQAIQILDQVTAQIRLTRQENFQVLEALRTLEEDVKPEKDVKPKK